LGKAAGIIQYEITNPKDFFKQEQFLNTVAKKLSMHLVASKPLYLTKQQVPKEFIDRELAVFK
jgi:translation elongation factor EF-Ts